MFPVRFAHFLPNFSMSLIETKYHDTCILSIIVTKRQQLKYFGRKLHHLRVHSKLTLKELARALGYSAHGHISELEAGKKVPTVEFVLKVADLFHVSTDVLIRDELELNDVHQRSDAGKR